MDKISLRSEEVQDILTAPPGWMIKWGTIIVFFVILTLFLVSWFVKYPDTINGNISVTTNIPPEKILAKKTGRIEAIFVKDKSIITRNMPIAIIENPASFKDVLKLKKTLDSVINHKKFPFDKFQNMQFGEIDIFFSDFKRDHLANSLNTKFMPYELEVKAGKLEDSEIYKRLNILQQQKLISEQELHLENNDYQRFQTLFRKGVISEQELDQKKLRFLQTDKNYKSIQNSISELKSTLISNEKNTVSSSINGTKESLNLENNEVRSFYALKKAIKDWELSYLLKSSIDGKISYLNIWSANQSVISGDVVFSVIPTNGSGFVGKIIAKSDNSGKIKEGQTVYVELLSYPSQEYGKLEGKVKSVALVADNDGSLLIDVSIPENLITTYNRKIPYSQDMQGRAEIVTDDLRLLQRMLFQFRKFFK